MSKNIHLCLCLISAVFLSALAFAQNPGTPATSPKGVDPGLKTLEAPTSLGPSGLSGPPGSMMSSGPASSPDAQEPLGEVYFSAGTVSSDGKAFYVVFDRYILKYTIPGLIMTQKIDLGFPVAPVTPSISMSSDGKWIYVIQNGVIVQIESESFKVRKTEKIKP